MNLNDYETRYFAIYEAFADTVRVILEKALLASPALPRPQSIQSRAKSVDSLSRRLLEASNLDTQSLESDRRDLAGARLIFYTNNDVERFLASPLIYENFEVEEDSTKLHHPIPENKGARYRAVHYTIRLREDRTRLPEYARFAGLRCEIQVQTILNHAWSETSHDVLYKKDRLSEGYGGKAMTGIALRFERIMDKYLIPAGFEIQKAQQEYERVLQGKELFDKDVGKLLGNAQNNNERYELLSGLKDYAIPHYDDLPDAFEGLKDALLATVKAARNTETAPVQTAWGKWEGFDVDAVTRLVVEIVESLGYANVVGALQLLIDIFRDEPSDDIRQQIVQVVKSLSEYNIDAYNKVGPTLQMSLVDHLAGMRDADVDSIRPIALTVWTEALQSDITGAKWTSKSIILRTGAVPASDQLKEVRNKAITGLFAAYDRAADDAQKRSILQALYAATTTPHQAHVSNELLASTLKDATRVVEFATERAKSERYEILQHLEHRFQHIYFRAKRLAGDVEDRFKCRGEATALVTAIFRFRDAINADEKFVHYKVLVGFESVFPGHWSEEEFDYKGAEEYRHNEADNYINEINGANESDWFAFLSRCVETESKDLATFPPFGRFLSNLAERKPEVADRLMSQVTDNLRRFLPAILNGLALSKRSDIYETTLEKELVLAKNLSALARHLRYSNAKKPDFAARLLKRAIEKGDTLAVNESLLFSLEEYETEKIRDVDAFLRDALSFLNARKDTRWVSEAWLLQKAKIFYVDLSPERTAQLLQTLSYLRKVDYQAERILVPLAQRQLEAVWDYFGTRLNRSSVEGEDEDNFEPVPFQFHGLEKELSKDPQLAIKKGLSWFARDPKLFQFRGGRLLSRAFPDCTTTFGTALAALVKEAGGDGNMEAEFALEILQNYIGGTSTHVVMREIVARFPNDAGKMSAVRVAIDSTGVVSGELGFAEAWREKRSAMSEWLNDERPAVKAFADRHISQLNLMIATEQARAETRTEMRNRDFPEDDEEGDHSHNENGEKRSSDQL